VDRFLGAEDISIPKINFDATKINNAGFTLCYSDVCILVNRTINGSAQFSILSLQAEQNNNVSFNPKDVEQ